MNTTSTAGVLPPLFISHGSPMIALEPGDAGRFLERLGPAIDAVFGRPKAILAVSAHTATREPVLLSAAKHETVHDFGGFPQALYDMRYDAPGAPELAPEVARLLEARGVPVHVVDHSGLDHGIWTALKYIYPDADVPVLPLSLVPGLPPAHQFAIGEALAPLAAQGVLIMGTGSITHNLRLLGRVSRADGNGQPEIPESREFRSWMADRSSALDWDALFDYRQQAPHAMAMHPTDEHLLPWYVAAGAGGRSVAPTRLYDGSTMGALGMDDYGFGEAARALHEAVPA